MNLEAIALRRAEEQAVNFRWVEEPPKLRVVKDKSRGGRRLVCDCGVCRRCKNRQAMREARALGPHHPPRKRGRKTDPDRKCLKCRGPIAIKNSSGYCAKCHRAHITRRANQAGHRPGWFSHAGGI